MSIRTTAASLIFGALLGGFSSGQAAMLDCSLPLSRLPTAQFEACLRLIPLQAKTDGIAREEAGYEDAGYVAPKPTTQRAYDDLLHAGD